MPFSKERASNNCKSPVKIFNDRQATYGYKHDPTNKRKLVVDSEAAEVVKDRRTSIIQSKRQARELVEAGAILVDGEKITDTAACVDKNKTEFLIKKGKKTFLKVIIGR